jgi:hypothetical protein
VLAIWPKGGARGGTIPLIAAPPAGGMIGYPSYTQIGILVKTVFNPQVAYGGKIQVQSIVTGASGTWGIIRMDHALDSLVPKGLWESSLWCFNPTYQTPVAPPP